MPRRARKARGVGASKMAGGSKLLPTGKFW